MKAQACVGPEARLWPCAISLREEQRTGSCFRRTGQLDLGAPGAAEPESHIQGDR